MGKAEKNTNEEVPGLSPQVEASKLLEAALLQMDGIISGNTGGRSPDSAGPPAAGPPPTVKEAANMLVAALQQCVQPPAADPQVRQTLQMWLQVSPQESYVMISQQPSLSPVRIVPAANPV